MIIDKRYIGAHGRKTVYVICADATETGDRLRYERRRGNGSERGNKKDGRADRRKQARPQSKLTRKESCPCVTL